ncbi:D-alanyl-D-alanine carboxypeptidase [Streptomyces sp. NBC_00286]|uniref:D-alanyl-D-alanine carboxypeptidase n=1 Tax=Streptomyces sp. NBC_00286 TaxID=2975701 RepID=UPI003FA6E2A4
MAAASGADGEASSAVAARDVDAEPAADEDASGDAKDDRPVGGSDDGHVEDAELSAEGTPASGRGADADESKADAAPGDKTAPDAGASGGDAAPASGVGAKSDSGAAQGGDEVEPEAGAAPVGEATPASGAKADSAPEQGGDADEPEAGAAPVGEVRPAPGAKADSAPEQGGDEVEPEVDSAPADETAPAPGADAKSGSATRQDAGAEPDSAPAQDADAKRDPRAGGGATPVTDRDDDGEPGSGAVDDKSKRPVDQPTATFKVRAPAVDQPTTTLKVGDAKPDDKPGDAKPDEKPKGAEPGAEKPDGDKPGGDKPPVERESERTSKFVALKPLDEPAAPKEKPVASPEKPDGPPEKPAVPPAAETAAIAQIGPERTAQQPLPPKPPLDLLAELTNTPPPPETPVRTIVRRVKIWTPLVILVAVVFAVVQAVRPLPAPELALTADQTYTFEGDKVSLPWPQEGQGWMDVNGIGTVDNFGKQQPVAIGSVAKAMTAYVILKDHPLKPDEEGKNIPVDAKAETEGGYDNDEQNESTLNTIKEGDTLTQRQALAAIMIPSANNVARLLARWDSGGDEAAFVKKMNDAAADLGMKNTKYTDPSGLKETTVSTAEDQVKLGNELVQMKALTDITRLPVWKDPSGKEWQNYNRLVPYDNAIGIKTGSTTKAGGNLLFAATEDVDGEVVTVVGAILGQHAPPIIDTVNAVSKTAMVAAQDALTSSKILKKGDVVGYVDDGLGGRTPVVATQDVSAVGWAGKTVELALSDDGTEIPHEAKAGTKVGSLSVGDGTGDAVEVPVALQKDLTEPDYGSKLTRVS